METGEKRTPNPRRLTRAERARRRRRKKMLVLAGMAAVAIFLIAAVVALINTIRLTDRGKIAEGVTVGGVSVAGMDRDEAKQAIDAHLTKLNNASITLTGGNEEVAVPLGKLGLSFADTTSEDLAKAAYKVGRKGGVFMRSSALRRAKKKGTDIPVTYSLNDKSAAFVLSEYESQIRGSAKDVFIRLQGESFVIEEGVGSIKLDVEGTLASILAAVNAGGDVSSLTAQIATVDTEPSEMAQKTGGMQSLLGSYTTSYADSNSGRRTNVERGMELLNGTIIKPGETISVDDILEPYTTENGYEEAGSFADGMVVDSMGGGICQVSSTLYNAALFAELEIVERYPHSMQVSYVEPARDAAISDDGKDLKIKNNLNDPIFIEAKTYNDECHVNIYGTETRPEGRTVELESEMLQPEEFGKRYVGDEKFPLGTMEITYSGSEGGWAVLRKIVKENGVVVEETDVNDTYYNPGDTIVSVGIDTTSEGAKEHVLDSIWSQDEETILDAINNAYSYSYSSDDY